MMTDRGKRTEQAMEQVRHIVGAMSLKNRTELSVSGLLNDLGQKYERSSPQTAELYVVGKRDDGAFRSHTDDLNKLVQIINVLQRYHLPPAEAGYILRKLNAIRQFYHGGQAEEEEA